MTPNLKVKTGISSIALARTIVASCAWWGRSPATWGAGGNLTYLDAVAELRQAIASSPPLDPRGSTSITTNMWTRRRREVRQLLTSADPATFLTWNPIVRSMTFGLKPWIRTEFEALRRSGEWEDRWKDALRENRAGLPMPSHVLPTTSGTLIHHAYHLHRFERASGRPITAYDEIVEFGGGYGSMARLVSRLGFRGRYHIYDLPEFSALQRFYLRSVRAEIGEGEIAEALSRVSCSNDEEDANPSTTVGGDAIFLATWSFAETPIGLREEWLPSLARFGHFLIGFRSRFEDVDNRTWFEEFAASRPDVAWRLEPVAHRGEELHYLFGAPKSVDEK